MQTGNFHLEISHRGSAKTYRIVEDIKYNLSSRIGFSAGYACPSIRSFNRLQKQIKEVGLDENRIFFVDSAKKVKQHPNINYYFDEFEYIDWLTPENVRKFVHSNCHFLSSSGKIRKLEDFSKETDVFAALLSLNDYFYIGRHCFNSEIVDKAVITITREEINKSSFDREYLSKFVE